MQRTTPRNCRPIIRLSLTILLVVLPGIVHADDASPTTTQTTLQRFCIDCHGEEVQEASVRLDTLTLDVGDSANAKTLERILNAVRSGEMPPEDVEQPSEQERASLVSWIEEHLIKQSQGLPRNRRLTVEEYNFTMQDLFGVDASFGDMLPPDPIAETGYRNDVHRLGLSSLQIEAYLDSARRAIQRYVQFDELSDDRLRYHIELEDLFYSTADRYGTRERAPEPMDEETFASRQVTANGSRPKYVDPLGPKLPGAFSEDEALRAAIPKLNQQYVAIPKRLAIGEMVVRVRAAGTPDRNGRFPRMRIEAGITLGDGCSMDKRVLGEVDVTADLDQPSVYEFRMRLEDVPTKGPLRDGETFDKLSVFDMDQVFISNISPDSKAIYDLGRGGYSDPETGSQKIAKPLEQMAADGVNFLHLDWLEIEMLPGLGVENRAYRWQAPKVDAATSERNETPHVREFLRAFMRAAFRRPVEEAEVANKIELFEELRRRDYSFRESISETLAAVLVSPSFLFLEPSPPLPRHDASDSITAHQLASRISYLLWLAPPDDELMRHADDDSILRREVLLAQAERLLDDLRSRRFLDEFSTQWLRLDKLSNIGVDRERYPTYDEDLSGLSIRETLNYVADVYSSSASALDLIDSNYAILNDRLAQHYGMSSDLTGNFRKVSLAEDSVRGGLLTQASLLTMNSDGIDSHPIRRGVWLLERMLNQPPPPPPPNVPDIDQNDPDFRGLSLKEQIELHRQPSACQGCHQKIDPWGIPFEAFDATGRFRDQIMLTESGTAARRRVDTATQLPDGQSISNITDLKRYLREQRSEQFAAALVHHLLTYSLGRPPAYADRPAVNEINERFKANGYRLRELFLEVIGSPLFTEVPADAAE